MSAEHYGHQTISRVWLVTVANQPWKIFVNKANAEAEVHRATFALGKYNLSKNTDIIKMILFDIEDPR